ncbi:hypothetical protein IJ670_04410 [bacterium]|nr:hypothetical protein [bacterium]
MEKTDNILILSYKFARKYIFQYLHELTKPIMLGVLGVIFFLAVTLQSALVLISLISIPLFCMAFWQGYVVTYRLIECADNFQQQKEIQLKETKVDNANFALYVGFCALLTLVLYIPSVIYAYKSTFTYPGAFGDNSAYIQFVLLFFKSSIINTIVLAPFINYGLVAYYFKKEEEGFLNLFLNCYNKINITGFVLALLIIVLNFALSQNKIGLLLCVLLNIFIYSINTFWYSNRINHAKIKSNQ